MTQMTINNEAQQINNDMIQQESMANHNEEGTMNSDFAKMMTSDNGSVPNRPSNDVNTTNSATKASNSATVASVSHQEEQNMMSNVQNIEKEMSQDSGANSDVWSKT